LIDGRNIARRRTCLCSWRSRKYNSAIHRSHSIRPYLWRRQSQRLDQLNQRNHYCQVGCIWKALQVYGQLFYWTEMWSWSVDMY